MINKYLYPCFDKWFEKGGNIFFMSDPHFNDKETTELRYNNISADEQVKIYNSQLGKNDTLVILGDVGDISYVSKLRAGYKVLIKGNHDSGSSNYKRISSKKVYKGYDKCPYCGDVVTYGSPGFIYINEKADTGWCRTCIKSVKPIKNYEGENFDNKLFDEVYEGELTLRADLVACHYYLDDPYRFSLYGHDHSFNQNNLRKLMFAKYDIDLNSEDYIKAQLDIIKSNNIKGMNLCTEWLGYRLVSLKQIIDSGVLKNIPSRHRDYIEERN